MLLKAANIKRGWGSEGLGSGGAFPRSHISSADDKAPGDLLPQIHVQALNLLENRIISST